MNINIQMLFLVTNFLNCSLCSDGCMAYNISKKLGGCFYNIFLRNSVVAIK